MLIRSQDNRTIIPLEKFAIGITKDNYIFATSNMYASPIEVSAGVLGKYSSEEKAIKVLNMICAEYQAPIYRDVIDEDEVAIYSNIMFHMPQDDEVDLLLGRWKINANVS